MKQPVRIFKEENTYDLHVMWTVHTKCNYACSYCPDHLHNGNTSWLKLKDITGFVDRIHEHYVKRLGYKNILFSLTGGEPTLWKDFLPFIEYIHHKGFYSGLTTNGSVSLRFWERVSTYFNYICLSFHPESADPDKFLKTYQFLHDHPQTVIPSVRAMMHPDEKMWEKSVKLIEELKKFPNWVYQCVHILDDYATSQPKKIDYHSKDKENTILKNSHVQQFHDNSVVHVPRVDFRHSVEYEDQSHEILDENKLINKNKTNFKGWSCHIGLELLSITDEGYVYRSACGSSGALSVLGHLSTYREIDLPLHPIVCNLPGCYCPTDIRISKSLLQETS